MASDPVLLTSTSATAGTMTSAPFTPAANSLLLIVGTARRAATTTPNTITITNTGGLTFNSLGAVGSSGVNPTVRMALWWAEVGPSPPVAMTVDITSSVSGRVAVNVINIASNYSTAFTNIAFGTSNVGTPSVILPSAPAATSLVLGAAGFLDVASVTHPFGTELVDVGNTGIARNLCFQNGSGPTSASWSVATTSSVGWMLEIGSAISSFIGSGNGTLNPLVGVASGTFIPAPVTGTAAATLSSLSGVASGNVSPSPDAVTGTGAGTLNRLGGVATGTVNPPPGVVSDPVLGAGLSTSTSGASHTSAPFTPSPNALILVLAGARRTATGIPGVIALTSTALTFTKLCEDCPTAVNPTARSALYWAQAGPSPVPMTVGITSTSADRCATNVIEIATNFSSVITNFGTGIHDAGDPAAFISPPAATSLVLGCMTTASGPATITHPFGTELVDNSASTALARNICFQNGSGPSSAAWNTGGIGAVAILVEIGSSLGAVFGAGAGTVNPLIGAAAGVHATGGPAAATLNPLVGAVAGVHGVVATAAGTLNPLTGVATGTHVAFLGTAAGTINRLTGAAVAVHGVTTRIILGIFTEGGTGIGTVSATSSAFTPAPNSTVIVCVSAFRNNATVTPPTITSSPVLTWTDLTFNYFSNWVYTKAWCTVVGSSPTSMTVTAASTSADGLIVQCGHITGASTDFSNLTAVQNSAGDMTLTLSSAPAAGSTVTAFASGHGSDVFSLPTGFTSFGGLNFGALIVDQHGDSVIDANADTVAGGGLFQFEQWHDATAPETGVATTSANTQSNLIAFEIKAAGAAATLNPLVGVAIGTHVSFIGIGAGFINSLADTGGPWSDGTLFSDGTGWAGTGTAAFGVHGVAGTAAGVISRLAGVAAGVHGVVATAAGTLNRLAGTAAGTHTSVAGTAAATLNPLTGVASGIHAIGGIAVGTLNPLSGTAAATHVPHIGTAAGILNPLIGAATGVQAAIGTAAATLSSLAGTATGVHGVNGTASATYNSLVGNAFGTHVIPTVFGNGAGILNSLTGAAIGVHGTVATVAGIRSALLGNAFGTHDAPVVFGNGAGICSLLTGAAVGVHGVTATAAGTRNALLGNATAEYEPPIFFGGAVGILSPLIGTAAGVHGVVATAVATRSALLGSVFGIHIPPLVFGNGAGILNWLAGAAAGVHGTVAIAAGTRSTLLGNAFGTHGEPVIFGNGVAVLNRLAGAVSGVHGVVSVPIGPILLMAGAEAGTMVGMGSVGGGVVPTAAQAASGGLSYLFPTDPPTNRCTITWGARNSFRLSFRLFPTALDVSQDTLVSASPTTSTFGLRLSTPDPTRLAIQVNATGTGTPATDPLLLNQWNAIVWQVAAGDRTRLWLNGALVLDRDISALTIIDTNDSVLLIGFGGGDSYWDDIVASTNPYDTTIDGYRVILPPTALLGNAAGTHVAFVGTGTGTRSSLTGVAAGVHGVVSTTAAGAHNPLTGTAVATHIPSAGTAAGVLLPYAGAAAGVHGVVGTAAGTLNPPAGQALGTHVPAAVFGTGAGTLNRLTGAATGLHPVAGVAAGTRNSLLGAATGQFTAIIATGVGTGVIHPLVGLATGVVAPVGTAAAVRNQLLGYAVGSSGLAVSGAAAGELGRLVGHATGTTERPSFPIIYVDCPVTGFHLDNDNAEFDPGRRTLVDRIALDEPVRPYRRRLRSALRRGA